MQQHLRFFLVLGLTYGASAAGLDVHLLTALPSPQPVGTPIGMTVRVANVSKGMHVFRFAVSVNGGQSRIIRDFSQNRDFTWTPALYEHSATIRVTARNNETKETAADEASF